ncbi:HAMP domain-containing sensor histidine kinase [Pseudoalteromonas sp. Of7M-16]|uniref:sensor histidine kinase n=1 Tax=Pseudoalteromonas sp. Of7M-16 TaxID=2917756 RepID=UPI001EF64C15|nr:HAMP domain-containing sensor histidine kinase [Pseudoalteromonas sp. Of7M-16]
MIKYIKDPELVFKAIKMSAVATILVVCAISIVSLIVLSAIDANQQTELTEYLDEVKLRYEEDGIDSILEELDLEPQTLWDRKESFERLNEHDAIFALFIDDELILGTELTLPASPDVRWQTLDFGSNQSFKLLTLTIQLDEQQLLSIAQPVSYEHEFTSSVLARFGIILSCILALSCFIYFLIAGGNSKKATQQIVARLSEIGQSPDTVRLSVDSKIELHKDIVHATNEMLDQITFLHGRAKTMSVGIAHDLKTPLSRVANRLQCMRQDLGDNNAIDAHITRASEDLNAVITTFNNLVRLNSIESGKHKNNFIQINLSELITDLALSYQPVFEDSGRVLELSAVDNVYCFGDSDLLNQLICNLFENALEYSHSTANVWIRLQSHTGSALLQVGDDGPGISLQDQPHIFERFYRADVSRSKPGNGLGLSIVKAICDVHDAQLCLLPDQTGAVFNIEVPISN